MATEDEAEESERSPIDQLDLIKSYLAFALRALRQRKRLAVLTFAGIFGVAIAALAVWPRTYHCESTIMIQGSGALIGGDERGALRGAGDVIRRRENLQKIVRATDLANSTIANRSGLQKFKDKLLGRGEPRAEDMEAPLLWVLQSALWVRQAGETLTFGVDWGNPEMAARLIAEAQKVYLEARHVSEISTIQEKMAIMDGHAIKVRKEIDAIAEQLKGMRDEKVAVATNATRPPPPAATAPEGSAAPAGSAAPPPPRRAAAQIKVVQTITPVPEAELAARREQIAALREELDQKKRAVKEIKAQRSQGLIAAQAQMAELLTKYTPAHPEVRRLERTIDSMSEDTGRTAPIEAEIATLTAKIKELDQAPVTSSSPVVTRVRAGSIPAPDTSQKAEAIPAEILKLLDSNTETDPAITVQLQGAIGKYAGLRDGIRTARVELDTAQAAFNHRYKIIEPPEPPLNPIKPNVRTMSLGAFFGALLVALLLVMVLELRRGKIVERWQIYQMKLPILAELRLPPQSRD